MHVRKKTSQDVFSRSLMRKTTALVLTVLLIFSGLPLSAVALELEVVSIETQDNAQLEITERETQTEDRNVTEEQKEEEEDEEGQDDPEGEIRQEEQDEQDEQDEQGEEIFEQSEPVDETLTEDHEASREQDEVLDEEQAEGIIEEPEEDTPLEDEEVEEAFEGTALAIDAFALPQPVNGFVNTIIIGKDSVIVPETKIPFSDLAALDLSEYGISSEKVAEGYTALHAVIALLQRYYGNNFDVDNAGYISRIGNLAGESGGNWSDGTGWYSGWYAALNYNEDPYSGIAQTAIYSGDTVVFYYYVSTSTTYAFFESGDISVKAGEPVEVVLKGIDVDWGSAAKGQVVAVESATIVDINTGGTNSYGVTDKEGKLSITFESAGSYRLTAKLLDSKGNNLLTYGECRISVSENPEKIKTDKAALEALIAQAQELDYTDYTVESWIPFSIAISDAREVYDRRDATLKEVDSARTALRAAMEALIKAGGQQHNTELHEILRDISDSYADVSNQGNNYLRDWQAFGMGAYSRSKEVQNISSFAAHSANQVLQKTRPLATDYEASAIAASALNIDAGAVPNGQGGYHDLIGAIANYSGASMGTVNAYTNALLAYDAGDYKLPEGASWTRERVRQYILDNQHSDGSWGLTSASDPDVTAMTISALAGYMSDASTKAAVDKAVTWLSAKQQLDGGFSNTSESTAQVITALSSLGIDAGTDRRFIKDKNSALDNLLSFKTPENCFKHVINGSADTIATEQAFYALVAYDRLQRNNGQPVNIFRFGKIVNEKAETPVGTVKAGTSFEVNVNNSFGTVKNAVLDVTGVNIGAKTFRLPEVTTLWDDVKMEIAAGTEMKAPGDFNGKIMVAGKAAGLALPENVKLQYAVKVGLANGTLTFSQPVRLFIPDTVGEEAGYLDADGKIIPIANSLKEDSLAAAKAALAGSVNEAKIKVNNGMVIWTNHFTTFLTYTTELVGNGVAANQNVYISVADPNPSGAKRTFLHKKAMGFQEGMTAFDLLKETGLWIEATGSGSTVYVVRIGTSQANSLGEFDEGPLSGWMYRVNGILYGSAAGSHVLQPGDYVEWLYTRNMGEDLDEADANGSRGLTGTITLENSRTGAPGKPKTELAKIYDILEKVLSEFNKKEERSDWEEIAAILRGRAVSDEKLWSIKERIRENGGDFRLVTDLAKTALMLQIAGIDITDFENVNLLEKIYNHTNMGKQGLNGYIFSLMVMYNAKVPSNAKIGVDNIIGTILAAQNPDGGFPLAVGSTTNSDITAMTMQALAPYVHQKEVAAGVNQALAYFEINQEEDGNFRQKEGASTETLSQLIIALASLGVNPDHQAFTKNGKTLLEVLLGYRNEDGGFAHFEGGASDDISTEQAALAFIAYVNFFEGAHPVYVAERKPVVENDEVEAEVITEEDNETGENEAAPSMQKVSLPYDFDKASSWARYFIEKAYAFGLIQGDELNPKHQVTRAEFVVILCTMAGRTPVAEYAGIFKDVTGRNAGFVERAHSLRWINGVDEESFAPDKPISRQDMAVIIANAYGLKPEEINTEEAALCADGDEAEDYAKKAIYAVMEKGIMSGVGGGFFDPMGVVTKEMAVTVMVRLFDMAEFGVIKEEEI